MGWDFRLNESFVTDDVHFGVFAYYNSAYPITYTNGDGQSINAGWDVSPGSRDSSDSASGNDPRIAGDTRCNNQVFAWRADLDSGSAPGAGDYLIDFAAGNAAAPRAARLQVKDDSTVLIDATNGTSGYNMAAGHYLDATLSDIAATTTWTGTPVAKTFASTIARFVLNPGPETLSFNCAIAHFRLTLAGGGATSNTTLISQLALLGVGA